MWIWDSICSAARKIDRTVREDAPAKLKQYTPDPKQLQHEAEKIGKAVRENAPDPRIFGPIFVEEIIKDSGLPGVRPLCRAWNRSGVASQMHSQDKVNGERISTDERERAEREKCMKLRQAIFILNKEGEVYDAEPAIKALKQSQIFQDCSDDVEREDK